MRRSRILPIALILALAGSLPALGGVAAAESPTRAFKAERYALKLLNCTRTGGWVTAQGGCKGGGSGKYSARRPALERSKGISNKVARPWSQTLVVEDECEHELPGHPSVSQRFVSAGYEHWGRGENIGCAWGYTPRLAVLMTHRGMQAEKSYGGGHWKNMKNRLWKRVGISVHHMDGRVVVVYDFYAKAVR